MQKQIKGDLDNLLGQELNLKLMFQNENTEDRAQTLSYILESLESLKGESSEKYTFAFHQMELQVAAWQKMEEEVLQIGTIYDEGMLTNLNQCKLACEHSFNNFQSEQMGYLETVKKTQTKRVRRQLHLTVRKDSISAEEQRAEARR